LYVREIVNKSKLGKRFIIILLLITGSVCSCKKDSSSGNWIISNYSGTYKNIEYTETLIREFTAGIYQENEIPEDLKQLQYGRIEIDFIYNGGGLLYFSPLMYYGSTNKNSNDEAVEEPKFHMAIEIGHYNVIPFPVEYLFYTICTFNYPQYCRDTFVPVYTGKNYTVIIDKKPEGMILQLRNGANIQNIFPHAFFPDSSQMFFKDVTSYTERNKGDSLKKVLMVGKGFAGIEKGLHDFNGQVTSLRIFKYSITNANTGYELKQVRNQHTENQQVIYTATDNLNGNDKFIKLEYQFFPYKFVSGELVPDGSLQAGESAKIPNGQSVTGYLKSENIGYYRVNLHTLDTDNKILRSTSTPFGIWIYPKEWDFDF
jgi:hypothetical protein